jgi:putative membrane protein
MILVISVAFAILLGTLLGTLTGLTPGIHINLVSVLLVAFIPQFSIFLIVMIVAMSITHTFLDFIPSVYLGSPDEDTGLSILPGHRLLLDGKGHSAVMLTVYGGLLGLGIIFLFAPFIVHVLPNLYPKVVPYMFYILLAAVFLLLWKEEHSRWWAILIFVLTGILGLITLNLPLKDPLFPLLTGLFGASSLVTSIAKKQKIPRQKFAEEKIETRTLVKTGLLSAIASPICSFLPSLGSGQAAVLGSGIKRLDAKEFLVLLGSINTVVIGLSFYAAYSIHKARTGVAAAVMTQAFPQNYVYLITIAILFSGIIAAFLASRISKLFARNINRLNYNTVSSVVLGFLTLLVIIFSGWLGFLVYLAATFTGLVTILSGIRRTHMMGSLMLPSILFYLPI